MSPSVPSGGRSLRLVSRTVVLEALLGVLSECLVARGFTGLELLRARRAATRALSERLSARSRRVRGLTRAEFLAEIERSRAGFASEKRATERALAELGGAAGTEAERVELLERRVAKMRRALEDLEASYRDLARQAEEDPGRPSHFRELRERTPEDRRAALTRVFELNVGLQQRSAG